MKLFSTSNLLIPNMLSPTTITVTVKIGICYFRDKFPRNLVIFDSSSSRTVIFFEGAKFNKVGSKVKVTMNEVINPKVIIQPKSIIGLISLKIKDKNAIIVVKTV